MTGSGTESLSARFHRSEVRRRRTTMRRMICSALALSLLTGAAFGQTVDGAVASPTEDKGSAVSATQAIGPPQTRTDGGDKKIPDPHIYHLGEHLSPAYGNFDIVADWAKR